MPSTSYPIDSLTQCGRHSRKDEQTISETRVALVVIFNHRFESNIAKLEEYYGPRFSNRRYLMPFAKPGRPTVIRVIENGFNFSGHIAQGSATYNDADVTHYAFVGDDLILNPSLSETNLVEHLNLPPNTGYIKELVPADSVRFYWPHAIHAIRAISHPGFDYQPELPSAAEAQHKFEAMGIKFLPPWPRHKVDWQYMLTTLPRQAFDDWLWLLLKMGKPAPYPLVCGYSDFVLVPATCVQNFAHYCGVFAAMNVFAEVATPTALALACPVVRTERALGGNFWDKAQKRAPESTLRGTEFWGTEVAAFCEQYSYKWDKLLADFPSDVLYYHPVKLSQWK